MSRLLRWFLLPLVASSVAYSAPLAAQQTTVFYVHGPKGDSTPQLYYRLAGQDTARRAAGVPNLLRVREGSQVCFRVDNANPLLYSYAIGTQVLKTETTDEISSVLRALLALVPLAPKLEGASTASGTEYVAKVGNAFNYTVLLAELRETSDNVSSLRLVLDSGEVLIRHARAAHDSAEVLYQDRTFTDSMKDERVYRLVRAQQLATAARITSLSKVFDDARATLDRPYCHTIADQRIRISLLITSSASDVPKERLAKMTGNPVASVDVEPVANRAVDFGVGMVVHLPLRRYSTYAVNDGILERAGGDEVLFRPLVLVNLRGWATEKVWLTLGTAGSANGLSDAFFGMTFRAGTYGGLSASLSGGLAITKLEAQLLRGTVGETLPSGVDLSDAVGKRWVPGFGLALAITGL